MAPEFDVPTSTPSKSPQKSSRRPMPATEQANEVTPKQLAELEAMIASAPEAESEDGAAADSADSPEAVAAGGSATEEASATDDASATEKDDHEDKLSVAVEATIHAKSIGDRIKYLRQRKGMGLVELGRHTGLSASFLSQLETGRVVPTLRNLARIAMVFSRDMSYFFEPEPPDLFRVVRAEDRTRHPQTGAAVPGYFFENLGGPANGTPVMPYIAEFLPADGKREQRSHQHAGAEFLYVLSGCLQIMHGERTETFEAGDAVYFHSTTTHSYHRLGDEACEALILTMPEPASGRPHRTRAPGTAAVVKK